MLSEETTIGKYPVQTVQVMDKILRTTEQELAPRDRLPTERHQSEITTTAAISHAVVNIAHDLKVAAILAPTRSGATARMVARYRPQVPIIALSNRVETVRWLSLVWGVIPIFIAEQYQSSDEFIARCKQEALATGLVERGDTVLIAAGLPPGEQSTTNLIKVEVIDT
jgi:pyruvate kinase